MSRLKTWKTAPARQERVGVESRRELALIHLANSTPTLSLCMTGRGESKGNEGEKRVGEYGEGGKHCAHRMGREV